ncbi:MAG TPA: carboxypeptidase regulatory-like domain-containing protein [Bryobacteraceae bacterium]|nr:carboxypeptidase regulatory-like domain-containing protein [Bryobacteraceae bacterium]
MRLFLLTAMAALTAVVFFAQTPVPATLTGVVTSTEEGPMEGVLVSAHKSGSTVTTTVVTDSTGHFRFPANRLEPGAYTLRVRAIGFEQDESGSVQIGASGPASANLKLHTTPHLQDQLSNAEWMMSVPGTEDQKKSLLNCVQCHTLQRIIQSHHDEEQFRQVVARMGSYTNAAFPLHPQKKAAERLRETRGAQLAQNRLTQAKYLSTINLGANAALPYDLKTLPRLTGRSTHVIITEYDLPRKTIEPHDVVLDPDGMVWFSDFGEQVLGKLDPKTGKVTEIPIPVLKPGAATGSLGLESDREGDLWLGMMFQGGFAKYERKSGQFQTWTIPAEYNQPMTQIDMVEPQRSYVDGKVWTQNNGFAAIHRLDLATGHIETFDFFAVEKEGENHNIYDVIPDSHNNAYFTDFQNEHIGRVDAKTGKMTLFATPTPRSQPRRGQMDSQDRVWFGEYRGGKIGMFDTRTEKFQEWLPATPYSAPYDVTLDRNGEAWTGSMTTDRVVRLNPATGQMIEYQLPRSTNIRRVFVDNTPQHPTLWVGNNHGASIVKVEPLD